MLDKYNHCKNKYQGLRYSSNNFGDFIILEYFNAVCVKVMFLDTGYTLFTRMCAIKTGKVKDKLQPSVFGVGFIGEGDYKTKDQGGATIIYKTWHSMLRRCYYKPSLSYKPTYKGCSVVEEWHNFQNFAKWFEENYIEGYHLDKDIKVEGNKVYGPGTCMFASPQDNAVKSSAKLYKLINPKGNVVEVYNMAQFCRDNGLESKLMSYVVNGKRDSHKGWTKYTPEEE